MIVRLKDPAVANSIFEGWEETLIWSCLQGIMGCIYGKDGELSCAMARIGDFCFFAGEPDPELVSFWGKNDPSDFVILVPQNEAWAKLIEELYPKCARRTVRYAIKKEPDVFDREKLQYYVNDLPSAYELRMIDAELYQRCRKEDWCADLVSNFASYDCYQRLGLGVCILYKGEIIAGASSYTAYEGGIEIEIDTRADFRRKGLATVCAAKLILECQKRNLYPSWDAQNLWSVGLAQKLGYHYDHTYTVYEVERKRGKK